MMGVMSVGKTYLGEQLAQRLGWDYFEGDSAHPDANKEKMRRGEPLNDEDRFGWLNVLATNISAWNTTNHKVVMTCSALKKKYRDQLRVAPVQFIYLHAPKKTLEDRAKNRAHEYMNPKLIVSQLETLEPPKEDEPDVISISSDQLSDKILNKLIRQLSVD